MVSRAAPKHFVFHIWPMWWLLFFFFPLIIFMFSWFVQLIVVNPKIFNLELYKAANVDIWAIGTSKYFFWQLNKSTIFSVLVVNYKIMLFNCLYADKTNPKTAWCQANINPYIDKYKDTHWQWREAWHQTGLFIKVMYYDWGVGVGQFKHFIVFQSLKLTAKGRGASQLDALSN